MSHTAAATMPIGVRSLVQDIGRFFLLFVKSFDDNLERSSFNLSILLLYIFIRRSLNIPDPENWRFYQQKVGEILDDREDFYDEWQDQEEDLNDQDEDLD